MRLWLARTSSNGYPFIFWGSTLALFPVMFFMCLGDTLQSSEDEVAPREQLLINAQYNIWIVGVAGG